MPGRSTTFDNYSQQARHGRTVDKRGQAGGRDDTALLSPFPRQRGAAVAVPECLQPREPVAAAGAAVARCHLAAKQLTAAVGEDQQTVDRARTILLVSAGGESSDAPAIWRHAAEERGAAVAGGTARSQSGAKFDDNTVAAGGVSAEPFGKRGSPALLAHQMRNRPSRCRCRHSGPKPTKTLQRKVVRHMQEFNQ